MLYGLRDQTGTLIAIGKLPLSSEWQPIDPVDDEARAFLPLQQEKDSPFWQESDLQFIRVLDDVIELLMEKQVFQFTELPEPAQKKLLKRRWHRQQLNGEDNTTHLIGPQEGLL